MAYSCSEYANNEYQFGLSFYLYYIPGIVTQRVCRQMSPMTKDQSRFFSKIPKAPNLGAKLPSKDSDGFVDCGGADPSNVSLQVRGAEMRIAETRAVNRALPGLLLPFSLWFAFLAWRPQAIGVLPHFCQGAPRRNSIC